MQAGWHSVHKYEAKKGLRAIDDLSLHAQYLAKFVIPKDDRKIVFDELEGAGISVTSVFGDLSSLCSFISNRYSP